MKPILFETESLKRAAYLDRPNHFTVRFRSANRTGTAYLANPGRLQEILLPGTELLLARRDHTRTGREAVGALWTRRWPGDRSRLVFLNAARCNDLAARLIDERLLPGLEGHQIVRRELARRGSRVDFLLSNGRRSYLLEVKSVTLVEHGLALFPDAVTQRGRRHLEELASREKEEDAGVLFLVQGEAQRFLPDFHNDLEFARALRDVRRDIDILALRLSPEWTADSRIRFCGVPRRLEIPWELLDAGVRDAGVYILSVHLPRRSTIEVGSLGCLDFRGGWYLYAGSARKGLSRRIARHLRRAKRLHWHIDHLRARSGEARAWPIRGGFVGECELARELERGSDGSVAGFGCTDCRCRSHLFHFRRRPDLAPFFQELLTRLRASGFSGLLRGQKE